MLWIGQFDPAGKRFLAFEREKCQHNGELMAVLTWSACSRDLMCAYRQALSTAKRMGYLPFNLELEKGESLTEHDFILLQDRAPNAGFPLG